MRRCRPWIQELAGSEPSDVVDIDRLFQMKYNVTIDSDQCLHSPSVDVLPVKFTHTHTRLLK